MLSIIYQSIIQSLRISQTYFSESLVFYVKIKLNAQDPINIQIYDFCPYAVEVQSSLDNSIIKEKRYIN